MPLGCFNIAAPAPMTFVLYYFVLISLMAGWLWNRRFQLGCVIAILLLSGAWFWQHQSRGAETSVSVLPLQGGEAIYAERSRASASILINCGDDANVQWVMKPFLRARGVNRLPALLLTHGAIREMGGVDALRALFPTDYVYASPIRFRSPPYRRVIERIEAEPKLLTRLGRGDQLGSWTVLHPDAKDRFPRAEDAAMVLRAQINGVRILLLSQLGRAGQSALLAQATNLHADIVVAGLPHGSEPLSEPLIEAIQPRAVIVTDSLYPATSHANRKLRQRLQAHDFSLWFTSDCGAITIVLRDGHWEIRPAHETENAEEPQSKEDDKSSPTPTEPEE